MSNAGSLGVVLTADNSQLLAKMVEAGTVTEREAKKMQRALSYISDQLRVNTSAQKAANDASAGMEKAATHMEHFGFQTSAAKRELIVLAHELSQGNYSRFGGSLMVLAERTNAMELAFSGAGLAIGGVALAIGGYVVALVAGSLEASKFEKSLIATNNAAGMTADSFDGTAAAIAKSTGTTIRSSKEALQELVSTGRFGAESIGTAAIAVVNMERLTGQSSEEIVKDFAKMTDGVTKWAQEHNKQYHFLTVAEFARIKALDDAGDKEMAAVETLRALSDQAKKAGDNLGYMARGWRFAKEEYSGFVDGLMNIGKAMTDSQRLAALQVQLAQLDAHKPNSSLFGGDDSAKTQKRREAIQADIEATRERMRWSMRLADQQAVEAKESEKGIDKLMEKEKAWKFSGLGAIQGGFTESMTDARGRMMALGKQYDYLNAGKQQGRQSFLRSEIDSYDELAAAERKAGEEAAKLAKEQDKSFNDWFQKFSEKDMAANMPRGEAVDTAMGKYLRDIGDQTKAAEQLVTGSMQRMEDAIVTFAKTGKLSFADVFSFMAEEYLRNMIRMAEKKYLLDGAGNFSLSGLGSALSGIGSFFGFTGHANGLSSVPYDGYPAILHEGERVMTKQENNSRGSSGIVIDASTRIDSVGAGVSRGEMHAAVSQANAASEKRIRRLMQQGVLQ